MYELSRLMSGKLLKRGDVMIVTEADFRILILRLLAEDVIERSLRFFCIVGSVVDVESIALFNLGLVLVYYRVLLTDGEDDTRGGPYDVSELHMRGECAGLYCHIRVYDNGESVLVCCLGSGFYNGISVGFLS